jgi:hypothetical protein
MHKTGTLRPKKPRLKQMRILILLGLITGTLAHANTDTLQTLSAWDAFYTREGGAKCNGLKRIRFRVFANENAAEISQLLGDDEYEMIVGFSHINTAPYFNKSHTTCVNLFSTFDGQSLTRHTTDWVPNCQSAPYIQDAQVNLLPSNKIHVNVKSQLASEQMDCTFRRASRW